MLLLIMELNFNPQNQRKIEEILERYPTKKAALLPVLWIAQEQFGHISPEAMELVAKRLDLSPAHVYGVVTFYTMYRQQPVGKYHIQVCRTLSCAMMGSNNILGQLKKRLGVEEGETTPDKLFTLSTVECLASCGTAPAMQINETYHENLTEQKVDEILATLKNV